MHHKSIRTAARKSPTPILDVPSRGFHRQDYLNPVQRLRSRTEVPLGRELNPAQADFGLHGLHNRFLHSFRPFGSDYTRLSNLNHYAALMRLKGNTRTHPLCERPRCNLRRQTQRRPLPIPPASCGSWGSGRRAESGLVSRDPQQPRTLAGQVEQVHRSLNGRLRNSERIVIGGERYLREGRVDLRQFPQYRRDAVERGQR